MFVYFYALGPNFRQQLEEANGLGDSGWWGRKVEAEEEAEEEEEKHRKEEEDSLMRKWQNGKMNVLVDGSLPPVKAQIATNVPWERRMRKKGKIGTKMEEGICLEFGRGSGEGQVPTGQEGEKINKSSQSQWRNCWTGLGRRKPLGGERKGGPLIN
jgi:hypothetical protein